MNDYDLWLASAELYSGMKIKLLNMYTCTENLWYHVINKKCHSEVQQNVINKLLHAWNSEKFNFIKNYIKNNNINVALYNDPLYIKYHLRTTHILNSTLNSGKEGKDFVWCSLNFQRLRVTFD